MTNPSLFINNFEIKNYEFQQKMKLINDKLLSINNGLNSTDIDVKSNKQSINSTLQKVYEIENYINALKKERQGLNNKITEMNLKIDSQEEKISKNNSLLNEAVNNNNSTLYKDLSLQISKIKDSADKLQDNFNSEISKIKNDFNQVDLIIKKNPFLNTNQSEKLTQMFKIEQVNTNELFRNNLKLITEEIQKIKSSNQENFLKIGNNFKALDNILVSKGKDIKSLEQVINCYTDITKNINDKVDKIKKEMNSQKTENQIDGLQFKGSPSANAYNSEEIGKIQNILNLNKKEINNLREDIQEINSKTIPDIYKFINDKIKNININTNNIKSDNEIENNFNNKN